MGTQDKRTAIVQRGQKSRRVVVSLAATIVSSGFAYPRAAAAQSQPQAIPVAAPVATDSVPVATPATVPGPAREGGIAKGVVKAPKYSDGLADLAAVALEALKARPAGAAVPVAADVESGAGVPAASGAQTQVAGGTIPIGKGPSAFAPAMNQTPNPIQFNVAPQGAGQAYTSTVIDTKDLGDFFLGTAISAPIDPKTQSIVKALPTDPNDRYPSALRVLATATAARIKGAKAAELEAAWMKTDDRRMTVILTALAQVGTMYRWTGNQPGGFDCSGLTSYAWLKAGVKIPRVSMDQITAANPKNQADLKPGDLLWRPGHIGLYLGLNDYMVHSPQTGKAVEVRTWGRIVRFGSPITS